MAKQTCVAKFVSLISGYTQILRPGVKASFGLTLDTQKLNDPNPVGTAHKVCGTLDFLFGGREFCLSRLEFNSSLTRELGWLGG